MAIAVANLEIDWSGCELIEQIPGKVSGRPVVRGTRILPDGIVNSYDAGESLESICEDWPSLSVAKIERLIEFAHAAKSLTPPVSHKLRTPGADLNF